MTHSSISAFADPEESLVEALEIFIKDDITLDRLMHSYPRMPLMSKNSCIKEIIKRIFSDSNFNNYIDCFDVFEKYLLALGQRDHFVHQFQVYLLGASFLSILVRKNITNFEEYFATNDIELMHKGWALSSLSHDLGYPFEVASEFHAKIGKLYREYKFYHLADHFEQIHTFPKLVNEHDVSYVECKARPALRSFLDVHRIVRGLLIRDLNISESDAMDLQNTLIGEFPKSNRPNHGYVSATLLANIILNSFLLRRNTVSKIFNSTDYKVYSRSISAICLHSMPSHVEDISFELNPFAFLLYLFDNLHDWGRAIYENNNYPSYHLESVRVDDDSIVIESHLKAKSWTGELISDTRKGIEKKKSAIEKLQLPKPRLSIRVIVNYTFLPLKTSDAMQLRFDF